jgi:hypothetical protein
MRAEGYEVLEAENGEEALAIAGQYKGGHPVAADRCNHAQTSRAGTGVAPAIALPGDESDLHVGLHGERAGAGWNAGAEYGPAAETVHGEKDSGSNSQLNVSMRT